VPTAAGPDVRYQVAIPNSSAKITDLLKTISSFEEATAINESGEIAGYVRPDTYRGIFYKEGKVTQLGSLGGVFSWPYDLNKSDQVVGYSTTSEGFNHAFLWQKGSMTDLGTLGGDISVAYGINDAGAVVGFSYNSGNAEQRAFLWINGVMQDLGTLGGPGAAAYGINSKGAVVGYSLTTSGYSGFIWQNGVMTDLGTLGMAGGTTAFAINDQGQVVGSSYPIPTDPFNPAQHAFLWENGVMTDLGTLGGSNSVATSISSDGHVAGWSWTAGDATVHAFIWYQGKMTDLGSLGGFSQANGVNSDGKVVGLGDDSGGNFHAILWKTK
jgi:probable HAF family extracellular repeat protein